MPHRTSNISSKMFNSASGAEIRRAAFTTIKCETFSKTSENLISKITKRSGDINVFTRFSSTSNELVTPWFNNFDSFFRLGWTRQPLQFFFHLLSFWISG